MYSKKQRHAKILELIRTERIERQEDLAAALNGLGYAVTQATVSRDIHELGLAKQTVGGVQRYVQAEAPAAGDTHKLNNIFSSSVLSIQPAQNLLVIKTMAGMAHGAAAAVDAMHTEKIIGSIAGDDTILVVTRSAEDAAAVQNQLQQMKG